MKRQGFQCVIFSVLFICACSNPSVVSAENNPQKTTLSPGWHKNINISGVESDIYIPGSYKNKNLILLPGWNFPRMHWVNQTDLLKFSDLYGYSLILPELKTTLYESEYFPETKMKWNPIPGGQYVKNHLIVQLQNQFKILLPSQKNFLLGLSTGGRGVALLALENPDLFTAGASLSGDFSQDTMRKDRLMTLVYGPYEHFSKRWNGKDNPQKRAAEWKMPLYLSHGKDDRTVPPSQTKMFYEELRKIHNNQIDVLYRDVPGMGHNLVFWGSELPEVFKFFNNY